jgi:hypothetical protein
MHNWNQNWLWLISLPRTPYVAEACLELSPPALPSQLLGLQVFTIILSFILALLCKFCGI